jgi:hypothetical protein
MQQRTAETQHQNPETTETRNAQFAQRENCKQQERDTEKERERGGGEYMSTVRYQIGRWDGKQKKQEGNKKGDEFA